METITIGIVCILALKNGIVWDARNVGWLARACKGWMDGGRAAMGMEVTRWRDWAADDFTLLLFTVCCIDTGRDIGVVTGMLLGWGVTAWVLSLMFVNMP